MIEYLLWHADRAAIVTVLTTLINPVGHYDPDTDTYSPAPIATLDPETGALILSEGVLIDELGPVVKTPATYDGEGNEVTPAVIIESHHVNMAAHGRLAEVLTMGRPAEGTIFERTVILSMLGEMEWTPSTVGEPDGLVGTSGVKISDPASVANRARVWAS